MIRFFIADVEIVVTAVYNLHDCTVSIHYIHNCTAYCVVSQATIIFTLL